MPQITLGKPKLQYNACNTPSLTWQPPKEKLPIVNNIFNFLTPTFDIGIQTAFLGNIHEKKKRK